MATYATRLLQRVASIDPAQAQVVRTSARDAFPSNKVARDTLVVLWVLEYYQVKRPALWGTDDPMDTFTAQTRLPLMRQFVSEARSKQHPGTSLPPNPLLATDVLRGRPPTGGIELKPLQAADSADLRTSAHTSHPAAFMEQDEIASQSRLFVMDTAPALFNGNHPVAVVGDHSAASKSTT
jgi:hypothetical protein